MSGTATESYKAYVLYAEFFNIAYSTASKGCSSRRLITHSLLRQGDWFTRLARTLGTRITSEVTQNGFISYLEASMTMVRYIDITASKQGHVSQLYPNLTNILISTLMRPIERLYAQSYCFRPKTSFRVRDIGIIYRTRSLEAIELEDVIRAKTFSNHLAQHYWMTNAKVSIAHEHISVHKSDPKVLSSSPPGRATDFPYQSQLVPCSEANMGIK
ncbi:uncharacterized protein BJ212DRAFT_1545890 [Suillus subaureus]|uniref:Uncharacterized protein n=1 Tax=Suillus subaureus TaxID=48587 RepID=A0A9P7JGR4_9AGAM|nr:uncharacterized protein BJ212DRAFT_1545890 [Suillus subaureus]KAG1821544.1 hypothetical protein BJ212DRAFT_1545890 [Suillus subaureus]